jgi:hypothetical protein
MACGLVFDSADETNCHEEQHPVWFAKQLTRNLYHSKEQLLRKIPFLYEHLIILEPLLSDNYC